MTHSDMVIRTAHARDAAAMLALFDKIDRETSFMLLEPGERRDTAREQAATIEGFEADDGRVMLVAVASEEEVVGFCVAVTGQFARNSACAAIVMGVERAWWGRGVGASLLRDVERWATTRTLRRLELTVMAHNDRAIALYQHAGFDIEGTRRQSVRVGGEFRDEVYMAKILI